MTNEHYEQQTGISLADSILNLRIEMQVQELFLNFLCEHNPTLKMPNIKEQKELLRLARERVECIS